MISFPKVGSIGTSMVVEVEPGTKIEGADGAFVIVDDETVAVRNHTLYATRKIIDKITAACSPEGDTPDAE